jgi:hypothetical protein
VLPPNVSGRLVHRDPRRPPARRDGHGARRGPRHEEHGSPHVSLAPGPLRHLKRRYPDAEQSFQTQADETADVSLTLETIASCNYPTPQASLRNGIEEADGSIPFSSTKARGGLFVPFSSRVLDVWQSGIAATMSKARHRAAVATAATLSARSPRRWPRFRKTGSCRSGCRPARCRERCRRRRRTSDTPDRRNGPAAPGERRCTC